VSLFSANMGYLDDVDTKKVVDFEAALHTYMGTKHRALLDRIIETGDYNEQTEQALHAALKDFKATHTW
jgi:F-type H+-transporting ATPase subunit alpha